MPINVALFTTNTLLGSSFVVLRPSAQLFSRIFSHVVFQEEFGPNSLIKDGGRFFALGMTSTRLTSAPRRGSAPLLIFLDVGGAGEAEGKMAAAVVWVREAVSGRVSVCEAPAGAVVRDLLAGTDSLGPLSDFYVKCNGRGVGAEEALRSGLVYSIEPRLCGGKGGFGSMLRALGAQIEKTTNREACRDLSGRRLRDVNHEKAMAEWIKKQAEREAEKEQRRLERLKRKLAEPKHYFTDPEYHQQCSDMSERLEDSVIKGLQASSSSAVSADSSDTRKRKKETESSKKESGKKKCLWTGLEGLEASSSSDSGSESDSESPCTSASCSSSDGDSDGPAQCLSSDAASEHSAECSGAGRSEAADAERAVCDPEGRAVCDPEGRAVCDPEGRAVCDPEGRAVCDPEGRAQGFPSIKVTETGAEHKQTNVSIQDAKDVEPPRVDPEPENSPVTLNTDQETPNGVTASFDLLTVTSTSELEVLGLEKLKVELMALGLKCGGTLQERAARLFSVRGLSREQIDHSLFAKPSKAKKK